LILEAIGVDINPKDRYNQTPLSWAARNGHAGVVKLLLGTETVDVNLKDTRLGRAPLLWAAMNGHDTVVKLLLATGAKMGLHETCQFISTLIKPMVETMRLLSKTIRGNRDRMTQLKNREVANKHRFFLNDPIAEFIPRQAEIADIDQKIKENIEWANVIISTGAKFQLFIKKSSISPYNDTTEAYLKFLFEEEQNRINVGRDTMTLRELDEVLLLHKNAVDTFAHLLGGSSSAIVLNEASMHQAIQNLYNLECFDSNISKRDIKS
jgi:ankyrin repeat protein